MVADYPGYYADMEAGCQVRVRAVEVGKAVHLHENGWNSLERGQRSTDVSLIELLSLVRLLLIYSLFFLIK